MSSKQKSVGSDTMLHRAKKNKWTEKKQEGQTWTQTHCRLTECPMIQQQPTQWVVGSNPTSIKDCRWAKAAEVLCTNIQAVLLQCFAVLYSANFSRWACELVYWVGTRTQSDCEARSKEFKVWHNKGLSRGNWTCSCDLECFQGRRNKRDKLARLNSTLLYENQVDHWEAFTSTLKYTKVSREVWYYRLIEALKINIRKYRYQGKI